MSGWHRKLLRMHFEDHWRFEISIYRCPPHIILRRQGINLQINLQLSIFNVLSNNLKHLGCKSTSDKRNRHNFILISSTQQKTSKNVTVIYADSTFCTHYHQIKLYLRDVWVLLAGHEPTLYFLPIHTTVIGVVLIRRALDH